MKHGAPPGAKSPVQPVPTGLHLRPAHLTARPADLATVSDRYVQDARSVSAWYSYIGTRYQAQTSFIGAPSLPVRLPAILVE